MRQRSGWVGLSGERRAAVTKRTRDASGRGMALSPEERERRKQAAKAYYAGGNGSTLDEIAKMYGVSRERVRQWISGPKDPFAEPRTVGRTRTLDPVKLVAAVRHWRTYSFGRLESVTGFAHESVV